MGKSTLSSVLHGCTVYDTQDICTYSTITLTIVTTLEHDIIDIKMCLLN